MTEKRALMGRTDEQEVAYKAGRGIVTTMEKPPENLADVAKQAFKQQGTKLAKGLLRKLPGANQAVDKLVNKVDSDAAKQHNKETMQSREDLIDEIANGGFDSANDLKGAFSEEADENLKEFYEFTYKMHEKGKLTEDIKGQLKDHIGKSDTGEGIKQARLKAAALALSSEAVDANDIKVIPSEDDKPSRKAVRVTNGQEQEALTNEALVSQFERSHSFSENSVAAAQEFREGLDDRLKTTIRRNIPNGVIEEAERLGVTVDSAFQKIPGHGLYESAKEIAGAAAGATKAAQAKSSLNTQRAKILDIIEEDGVIQKIMGSKKIPDDDKDFFSNAFEIQRISKEDNQEDKWIEVKEDLQDKLRNGQYDDAKKQAISERVKAENSHLTESKENLQQEMRSNIDFDEDGRMLAVSEEIYEEVYMGAAEEHGTIRDTTQANKTDDEFDTFLELRQSRMAEKDVTSSREDPFEERLERKLSDGDFKKEVQQASKGWNATLTAEGEANKKHTPNMPQASQNLQQGP